MARTNIVHIAVRQRRSDDSILRPERAAWLWLALRRLFPDALAAVLMRDHFHVLTPVDDLEAVYRSLARVLANYTRVFHLDTPHWAPLDPPIPVRNRTMLALAIRYIVLNPCRAHLVRDPLEWLWSTYRDVMGAVAQPWVCADRLEVALGQPVDFRPGHHRFVTSDPHVSVQGTQPPKPATTAVIASLPLERIATAAAAAFRQPAQAIRRRGRVRALFVALAKDQGWRDPRLLAEATASSKATVNRLLRASVDSGVLCAARLCLGDARLLRHELAAWK